ncbi:hypothetical protein WJX74_001204 [Apatococcus lobatus]|uniref:Uncharacterized protein n=1 Tax=Apatococcus lobatus TaxID=904363 RepID=A0AAW1Q5D8_9CHLO
MRWADGDRHCISRPTGICPAIVPSPETDPDAVRLTLRLIERTPCLRCFGVSLWLCRDDALLDDFVRATCSALRPRFEASLSWPVACVFRGRWTDQRSVTGTLATIERFLLSRGGLSLADGPISICLDVKA